MCWPGIIVDVDLAPANAHDLHLAEELLEEAKGRAFGGQELLKRRPHRETRRQRVTFAGPLQVQEKRRVPLAALVDAKETLVETVISQLVERYNPKKVWARDRWHLTTRFLRKVLSHTMAVHFCQQVGLSPLRFAELLTD